MEADAIAELDGDAMGLMRRAGKQAWRVLLAQWPQAQRIGVACGPGNNGGDGLVLARHALQAGRKVSVVHPQGHAPRSDLARQALAEFVDAGGVLEVFEGALPEVDVWVDALFGIGLARAPDAASAQLIEAINRSALPVLALDVPSGLDADTGHAPGAAIRATHTLEFIAAHFGNRTGEAADCVGTLARAQLDVADAVLARQPAVAEALHAEVLAQIFIPRARSSHKGHHGHVLCIGGDHGGGGAIAMAAEAALRSGAGLVSAATRAAHVSALLARRPECMAHAVDDAGALAPLLQRCDVIAIGPGLGQGTWARDLLRAALAAGKPLLLDADALNLLASGDFALPSSDIVLTPHPGEAARLLSTTIEAIQRDRLAAATTLAERHGCVVVLKGAGTLVAAPGQRPRVICAGNPGMATGGMGDVLSGIIAALRGQGLDAFDAASIGALLHAAAADQAAGQGERGLLPTDLFPALRALVNGIPNT